jgi:hypothetical protein
MTDKELMQMALDALENSVDLVVADACNAEQLYGKYPSRQARVGGLKLLADAHQLAIAALKARREQPTAPQPADEPLACDGSCEEHIGVTIPVIVEKWGKFTYCETAISEDRARGLVVNPIEQPKESTK